jgi:hypothetical protein
MSFSFSLKEVQAAVFLAEQHRGILPQGLHYLFHRLRQRGVVYGGVH